MRGSWQAKLGRTGYDKKSGEVALKPVERVMVFKPAETQGKNRKLARPFHGLYRVLGVTYQCRFTETYVIPRVTQSLFLLAEFTNVTQNKVIVPGLKSRGAATYLALVTSFQFRHRSYYLLRVARRVELDIVRCGFVNIYEYKCHNIKSVIFVEFAVLLSFVPRLFHFVNV